MRDAWWLVTSHDLFRVCQFLLHRKGFWFEPRGAFFYARLGRGVQEIIKLPVTQDPEIEIVSEVLLNNANTYTVHA